MSPHSSSHRQPLAPPQPGTASTALRSEARTKASPSSLLAGLAFVAALAGALGALFGAARRVRALRTQLRLAVHEAGHDPLTDLPNRRAAMRRLAETPIAMVGLLDLDHFKEINDRHGHEVGDQLLRVVAHRLRTALGSDGMVARLAGDEFLILWNHRPMNPHLAARRLLAQVAVPVTLDGHALTPAASIGLAVSSPRLAGDDLLAAADHAMYQAKQSGAVRLYGLANPPGPSYRTTPHRRALRTPQLTDRYPTPATGAESPAPRPTGHSA